MLAACGSADPLPGFEIRLRFNTDALHGCSQDDCSFYKMACSSILSIRIVDSELVDDGAGNQVPANVYADNCIRIRDTTDLCALSETDLALFDPVPAKKLLLQVAVWSPKALEIDERDFTTNPVCPTDDLFNLQLVPSANHFPRPAFGGAVYFEAGATAFVDVPLACPNAGDVNASQCLPDTVVVQARVHGMQSTIFVPEMPARELDVSIAKPTEQTDNGETEWIIETGNAHRLTIDTEEALPRWNGAVAESFGSTACMLVLDRDDNQSATTAHCSTVAPGADQLPDMLGLLLSKTRLTTFLDAMGLTRVPDRGIVVGRVVNRFGVPQALVEVKPKDPTLILNIEYLSFDEETTTTLTTNENGYFFVTDAPFGTEWQAEQLGSGRRENGIYQAGLLADKVSVIMIRLKDAPPEQN